MYRHLDSLASAALQTGIRAVISNNIALPEHMLDSVDDNVQAFKRNNNLGNGRIKVWLGLVVTSASHDLALARHTLYLARAPRSSLSFSP
jgi:5-methylthioadenosine/S-adenosylhomocysteine deaminase